MDCLFKNHKWAYIYTFVAALDGVLAQKELDRPADLLSDLMTQEELDRPADFFIGLVAQKEIDRSADLISDLMTPPPLLLLAPVSHLNKDG